MWGRLVGVLGRGWWRYWEGVGGGIGKGLVGWLQFDCWISGRVQVVVG